LQGGIGIHADTPAPVGREVGRRADKAVRWSAAGVTAGVAGTAGWVSYGHALDVVRLAGESGTVAYVYPVFVDGLVYMSSMVLLAAARRQQCAHPLAWWALAAGIVLTLGANIYSMASHGVLGGFVGALPAVALVLSYELLMIIVRKSAHAVTGPAAPVTAPVRKRRAPAPAPVPEPPASLNGHGHAAAELFAADVAVGRVPGLRRIRAEMRVGQPRAQAVQAYLTELAGSRK
jgi:Protein of unknown function (DUF2637)